MWTRRDHLVWRLPADLERASEAHRALFFGVVDKAEYERTARLYLLLADRRIGDPVVIAEERRCVRMREAGARGRNGELTSQLSGTCRSLQ